MTELDTQNIQKILIRSTNWLGDAVLTTPAMGQLRKAFPKAEIVVAANPAVAEMLAHHPDLDRVMVWDKKHRHKGIHGLVQFSREVRKEKFDLAVLFQNAFEAAFMVWLARVPRRMGYRTDGRALLLNYGVPVSAAEHRLHHSEYYANMMKQAGVAAPIGRPRLYCSKQEIAWAEQQLPGDRWVAINPGAAYGSAKRWLPERFAEVAEKITEELGARIALIGSQQDVAVGAQIVSHSHASILNCIGKTTIRQLMALLTRCQLLITNDSGPMHMAAALATPLVAVFGPTDPLTTSPVTNRCRIVRHPVACAPCLKRHCPTDHRCMTAISVDEVMDAAHSLWMGNW